MMYVFMFRLFGLLLVGLVLAGCGHSLGDTIKPRMLLESDKMVCRLASELKTAPSEINEIHLDS